MPGDRLRRLRDHGFAPTGGRGQIIRGPQMLAVVSFFDEEIRKLGRKLAAEEHRYPPLLSRAVAERLGYFSSFPQHAVLATAGGEKNPKEILTPAACYHAYELLEKTTLPGTPYVLSASAECSRFEGSNLRSSPERLFSFTMREIVFFDNASGIDRLRRRIGRWSERLFARIGLDVEAVPATDSFFLGESRGKALLQRLKMLKVELRIRQRGRKPMALASLNDHEDFFGRAMKIRRPDGSLTHSGCAAFGLERCAYAFLQRHGTDGRHWPAAVARHLKNYATG